MDRQRHARPWLRAAIAAGTALVLGTGVPVAAWWEHPGGYAELRDALAAGDYAQARIILHGLADGGDTLAQSLLAQQYVDPFGIPPNPNVAIAWLESAAEAGSIHAMLQLGTVYRLSGPLLTGARQLYETWPTAVDWYRRAADAGSAEGAYQAGALYRLGMISRQLDTLDREEEDALARRYLAQAAAAGHPLARFRLAVIDGFGRPDAAGLRAAAEGIDGIDAQGFLAMAPGALGDQLSAREIYFWSLVTQRNLEMTRNLWVPILDRATAEDFAADVRAAAERLPAAERAAVEAEAAAYTADWVDPMPR